MNLKSLDWDDHMLSVFNIPKQTLPKILCSTDDFGVIKDGVLKGIPLTG
jgi:glycerol kinase